MTLAGAQQLAVLDCESSFIHLRGRLLARPGEVKLTLAGGRALQEAATLINSHPEILLVRIEVSHEGEALGARDRRRIGEAAQLRADLILRHLWLEGRVSPERLEAVGYGTDDEALRRFDGTFSEQRGERPDAPWRITLRAVQWSRGARRPLETQPSRGTSR